MEKSRRKIGAGSGVTCLPGISTVREKSFASLGIETLGDLICHFPRAYQNRQNIKLLQDADPDTPAAFILTVGTDPKTPKIRANLSITKFKAFDESGTCEIIFYNRPYADKSYPRGSVHRFYGKLTREGRTYRLSSPESEPYFDGARLLPMVPVYPLGAGLTQKLMLGSVRRALDLLYTNSMSERQVLDGLAEAPIDPIPDSVRENYGLCTRAFAYENIHFPTDEQTLKIARDRLAFEELFLLSVFLGYSKRRSKSTNAPAMSRLSLDGFYKKLPFELTASQKRVIEDIKNDLSHNTPMSRLVSGDVGSGKTVCAAAAMYIAAENGYQSALMAPTEILANQHFADLAPQFESFGFKTALLTGSTKASEKKRIYEGLTSGDINVVIGTHALLSDKVTFDKLGLVITDEQHRFGVNQRAALGEKSEGVHVLVMSATPIPRTLALILYGDLDVSQISEMPPGRQRVDTFVVDEGYRARLNGFIRKQVEEGHRVYVVCPTVEESETAAPDEEADLYLRDYFEFYEREEKPPLKSTLEYARKLREEVFPDLGVGYIHGKMKSREKDEAMAAFVRGDTQILVSTTVIEVGVNVPEATLMVVENAERFGLSQLHQLRGRVGRGKDKSYCILVSDVDRSTKSYKRLDVMKTTYNGYDIAEKDLDARGPGDFMSAGGELRQHGKLKLKLAEFTDAKLMLAASDAAGSLLTADPDLSLPENTDLKNYIKTTAIIRAATVN